MELNKNNYYSLEADMEYMSVSQFKGFTTCEAREMAKLSGKYQTPESTHLAQGRLFETILLEPEKIDEFKKNNPGIYNSRTKELKAEFKKVEEMVERVQRDHFFMEFIGDSFNTIYQHLVVGEIAGIKWKGLIDIYQPESQRIIDLKSIKDFQSVWNENLRKKINFIEAMGYDTQLAVYKELVRQTSDNNIACDTYIAGVTKEVIPDYNIFMVPEERLSICLNIVEELAPRYNKIKQGEIEPVACGVCDYCRQTKTLDSVEVLNFSTDY